MTFSSPEATAELSKFSVHLQGAAKHNYNRAKGQAGADFKGVPCFIVLKLPTSCHPEVQAGTKYDIMALGLFLIKVI